MAIFIFNDPATTEIYTLSLHDALPISLAPQDARGHAHGGVGETRAIAQGRAIPVDHRGEGARMRPSGTVLRKDRKSTRLNSSHSQISYAVFYLKTTSQAGQSAY